MLLCDVVFFHLVPASLTLGFFVSVSVCLSLVHLQKLTQLCVSIIYVGKKKSFGNCTSTVYRGEVELKWHSCNGLQMYKSLCVCVHDRLQKYVCVTV